MKSDKLGSRQLWEQFEFCSEILDRMNDGVILDGAGKVLFANTAFIELAGISRGEILNRPVSDLINFAQEKAFKKLRLGKVIELRTGIVCVPGHAEIEVEIAGPYRLLQKEHKFGLFVIRDMTAQRHLERELVEIADLAAERIARDLHDVLGQDLAAISCYAAGLRTSVAKNRKAGERMVHLLELVNDACQHIRQLAHGLDRPSDRAGIEVTLERLARNTRESHSVLCTCRLDPLPQLSSKSVLHLQRIAQEAITNAVRHGRARSIELILRKEGDRGKLMISDDGDGFANAAGRSGIGLRLMAGRAKEMWGQVEIGANPRGGTTVVCSFPVPRSPRGARRANSGSSPDGQLASAFFE